MSTSVVKPQEIYPEQEVQVYKKVIWKLIPFLCFCYIAAYLDRINVGIAKLHMLNDVNLSEAAFGLGAGLFLLAILFLKYPVTWFWKRSAQKFGLRAL